MKVSLSAILTVCLCLPSDCSSLLSSVVINPRTKSGLRRKGFQSTVKGSQAGTEAEMMAIDWLGPSGLLGFLSYPPQDHLARDDTARCGLGPSTSIVNQGNSPQVYVQVNRSWALPRWKLLLLRWHWLVSG